MAARKNLMANTTAELLQLHSNAQEGPPLSWPEEAVALPTDPEQRKLAQAEFAQLQGARSRDHWRDHHAAILAEYCVLSLEIRRLTELIRETGGLTIGKNGHQSRDPNLDVLSLLMSLRSQVTKQAGIAGTFAENDGQAKRAGKVSQTRTRVDGLDSLLA